ncbi:hypothetical protein WA026_002988 [Henosepilachna vigintioctopunctata]|uniref:Nas2 N-terminal domain-containing protein n=1 Tax=Henosepilachna vigintioctopunctata TaxID=420089 RepID=A0AAW1TMT9_9CUCU
MSQLKREEVLKLMETKDKIEDEIKQLTDILNLNGVGMNDPLVDPEGFPINSVDVYQVRHARNRIICLQNDHKGLMKKIENGLHDYYCASNSSTNQNEIVPERHDIIVHKIPFAKINLVSDDSPAQLSGLNTNDELVEFGSINKTNFTNIADIAAVVQHSEGKALNIKVKRGDGYFTTSLRPKKWNGKGLLGCNIVPV